MKLIAHFLEKTAVTYTFRSLPNEAQWSHTFSMDKFVESCSKENETEGGPGPDGVFPEFLRNLKSLSKHWLLDFSNDRLRTGEIPNEFRKSKILAEKPADVPSS